MVKKKTTDQEEKTRKIINETSEYKENSNPEELPVPENEDKFSEKEPVDSGTRVQSPETPFGDIVVSKEEELLEKLAEMQDKYLRLSAEFDNYRKRTLREKIELSKNASEDLLLKVLPVMDDFERALSHMEYSTDCSSVKNGIDLIYTKFADFLHIHGVREIESLNRPFNVDLHDAVAKVAVEEEDKKGKVIEVVLKGYYLNEKVIRHSKVIVGE